MSEPTLEESVRGLKLSGCTCAPIYERADDDVCDHCEYMDGLADEVATQTDLLRDRNADLEFEYGLRVKGEATIAKLEGVLQALEITRRYVDGMDVISVGSDQLCGNDPDFPTSEGYVEVAAWLDAEEARKALEDTDE